MNKSPLYLSLSLLLAMPVWAAAGGGRGGSGGGAAARQRSGSRSQVHRDATQRSTRDRQQLRALATDSQRECYRLSGDQAERVRQQAGAMREQAAGPAASAELLRRRDQLRMTVEDMLQRHQRLVGELGPEQRQAQADRLRKLDAARDTLRERARSLDQACEGPRLEREQIEQQAGKLERAAEQWQKRHHELGSELGLQPPPKENDDDDR
jgi:hypothetical protein